MQNRLFALFDLDNTLADSIDVKHLRDRRDWPHVREQLPAIRPFDGISELWAALRIQGVYLAVVTHSPRWYAQQLLGQFQLEVHRLVAYSDLGGRLKPDPYGYRLAIQGRGFRGGVAVGDERRDMEAAVALPCVGLYSGWSRAPSLSESDCRAAGWHYARRPTDVLAVLASLVRLPDINR